MTALTDRDPVKLALALARLRTMPPAGLDRMKAAVLERFEQAALDVAFAIMEEHKRREETPRGAARLRLVAKDGELTEAGLRSARALRGARTRRRRQG